jgi:precorrin-3B synthase
MPSGDGLLLRLSLPPGSVPPALTRGIASCARRFGNGLVDLTRRANLQLRGVSEATLPALREELSALENPAWTHEAEAHDVLVSPLAGIDPKAACDILPVAAALRERLAADPHLRSLPAKFCFLIDDGGRLGLGDIAADIRFKARRFASGPVFTIALGGHEEEAAILGACTGTAVADIAARLARAFLELRGEGEETPHRMARLVERRGAETVLRAAGLEGEFLPLSRLSPRGARPEVLGRPPVGLDTTCETFILGFGAPFGRLTANQLEALAAGAQEVRGELRLTPWRALLVTARFTEGRLARLRARLAQEGLITATGDARLKIAACPGAPACPRATVSTRDDALALAPLAQGLSLRGIGLHMSGCAKGCAWSQAARVTLVGRDGRYDLVRDGTASDPPSRVSLSLQDAKVAITRIVKELSTEPIEA